MSVDGMPTRVKGVARAVAIAAWIGAVLVALTWAIGRAAEGGVLIPAAAALALVPIAAFAPLASGEERLAYAVLTVWLGSTYTAGGETLELIAFAAIAIVAIMGWLRSPVWLVAAWFAHIAWDFVPRDLPALYVDLPVACIAFDGIIGAWLAWRIAQGRWATAGATPG
jgi:hypothetical protein